MGGEGPGRRRRGGGGGSSSRWGPPAAARLGGRSSESPPHGPPAKVGFFKSGPCAPRTACGTARPQEHFGVTDDRPADLMQSGAGPRRLREPPLWLGSPGFLTSVDLSPPMRGERVSAPGVGGRQRRGGHTARPEPRRQRAPARPRRRTGWRRGRPWGSGLGAWAGRPGSGPWRRVGDGSREGKQASGYC